MLHFANEGDTTDQQPQKERFPVAIRDVQKENQEHEVDSRFFNNKYPPVYYSPGMHRLAAVSAFGDSVELEDGSVWKVSPYDASKVAFFTSQDPIVITQNHRWFSKYQYKLINQSTGASLETNLHLGPIKDGAYTLYVIGVDTIRGEVILSDQTRWGISSYDFSDFQDWILYDAIIIGHNSGWDSGCQGLLINVTLNSSVRAEQF